LSAQLPKEITFLVADVGVCKHCLKFVNPAVAVNLSAMSAHSTSQLLELPPAWLVLLIQHVARGHDGLANAAALGRTCKFLHSLSEGPAVTYRNLSLAGVISSPDHPVWKWLAKRSGRVAGLDLNLRLGMLDHGADQLPGWVQPLQILSGIPDVQLRVDCIRTIERMNHPYIDQWLKQHGQLISHLSVGLHLRDDRLKLKDFAEAAAPCRDIDLLIQHPSSQVVDLADLVPVAGSLRSLCCCSSGHGSVRGLNAFTSMSQLLDLCMEEEDLESADPWDSLGRLTSLQQLDLSVSASGDPSPLSALTRLTYLNLHISQLEADDYNPCSFTSLQPLSTLQQLELLQLGGQACGAASLQGLAGLSNLKRLSVCGAGSNGKLKSLEGISPTVTRLCIIEAPFVSLSGIECCASLSSLSLHGCGVSSLQPLRHLSSMKELEVYDGRLTSLEGLSSMAMQSLSLDVCSSLCSLSGVEHLSALQSLAVINCGITSLQPLSELGEELQELEVLSCSHVREVVLELPHVQPTADVEVEFSNVREVVLAGGVRRRVNFGY
jgi:Leucine-rich repeat (LRR) protein